MQRVAETDPLSYYQIAGIHGLPHIPWEEAPRDNHDPDYGYCARGSALFCDMAPTASHRRAEHHEPSTRLTSSAATSPQAGRRPQQGSDFRAFLLGISRCVSS